MFGLKQAASLCEQFEASNIVIYVQFEASNIAMYVQFEASNIAKYSV